ncbi:MAG: DUF4340 domain-containing protein [Bdellovibrionales bacterium]|nr:DUF4340 domain-containing protein [Bdellovibrionales bacterium]
MKKTTWFAVFVAVLVGATYYFEFYQANREENKKADAARIVAFPVDQINQIEVQNKTGKILLKRDTEGWRLEEPVKDWADNQFTEDFVNGLVSEKSIDTIAAEGETNWPVYGLDKEYSKVIFTNQAGQSVLVDVSSKKNFEGNSFLRRGSENQVLVATSQWALRANKTPMDFRDKRFFRGKIGSVEEIKIKSQKDDFTLVNKDNKWINEKNPKLKLDQNKVREILTSLNEIHATEFLDKAPSAPALAKISLKLKDKSWSGEIRQGLDKTFYGVTSEPVFNLKLEAGQVDKFTNMTLMSLRDRKEPFDFQNLMVRKIEINTTLKKMALVKAGDKWTMEGNEKANIDQNAVRAFITRFSDTGVTEYLDKKEQTSFKNPQNKIILKGDDQKVLFDVEWGPEISKKALVGEKKLILAKTSLFDDVFGLDPTVIEAWGLMGLLPVEQTKDKAQKETP